MDWIDFKRPEAFEWEAPEGYEIRNIEFHNPFTYEIRFIPQLVELSPKNEEEQIEERIKELKIKIIKRTITEEEKEELKLLVW